MIFQNFSTSALPLALWDLPENADRHSMTTADIRILHLDHPEPACYLPADAGPDHGVTTVSYCLRGQESQTYCPWFSVFFRGAGAHLPISDFGLN